MSFANFYVGETEINKQFKGCYRQQGPTSGTVGTLSGESIPKPLENIKPVMYKDDPTIWIFGAIDGDYYKMVGVTYGKDGPKRVDGRSIYIGDYYSPESINVEFEDAFWEYAQYKDIPESAYTLTISNNSPLRSVNECMEIAAQEGTSIFGVANMNQNGLGQCLTGSEVKTAEGTLLATTDEPQCLTNKNADTVYTVKTEKGNMNTLGKTYLGKKDASNGKTTFHEYPSSMLGMGEEYIEHAGFDSPENNLANADITEASSEQCKQFCINRGQDCKGFVYDRANQTCTLKGEIYPVSKRKMNDNLSIYTRMPNVKNDASCPKGVRAVNTNFLGKNGFLSSKEMSLEFQCETEAQVTQEQDNLDASYKTLTGEVAGLRKENERILKGFKNVRKNVRGKTDDYREVQEQINKAKENPTVDQLLSDSTRLETSFSMRNTGLVLGLLLLSIFLLRVLRK